MTVMIEAVKTWATIIGKDTVEMIVIQHVVSKVSNNRNIQGWE
ncbi:hypothetical protein [Desemzia sp. RIT 804]|nr:hypothetical protein [Desemzia sp. RIT 804]